MVVMISKASSLGFALLLLGIVVGIFGAITPVSSSSQQSIRLVDTPLGVDPNDYATQNLQMVKGQTVNVNLSIDNQSVMFTFDIESDSVLYLVRMRASVLSATAGWEWDLLSTS